jgi:hypothetical protein
MMALLFLPGCASPIPVNTDQELRNNDSALDELEHARQQNPATRDFITSPDPSRERR